MSLVGSQRFLKFEGFLVDSAEGRIHVQTIMFINVAHANLTFALGGELVLAGVDEARLHCLQVSFA